jgi:acyl-coenzyme A thioesterase PaaI-like protein
VIGRMSGGSDAETSIQDRYFAELRCFGCGPKNARGLRLRSYADEDGSVRATFSPWPEHDNGIGFLNGGIIATLLDCHSAAAVAVRSEQLGLPPNGLLHYVTAGLDVRYLRPAPLRETVDLIALIGSADENEMIVEAELWWEEKPRAVAQATWKRWRPRPEVPSPQH